MRQTYLVFFTVLLVISALLLANLRINLTGSSTVLKNGIFLENLPISYCPKQAEIYQEGKIQSNIVTVIDCSSVSLDELTLPDNSVLTVKLPKALAFTVNYNEGSNRYTVGLRVGDVTEDNIIDEQDEKLVTENLFNSNPSADADMDGEVTVHDLSLTRTNKAVGVQSPSSKEWTL